MLMKTMSVLIVIFAAVMFSACDVQSGIAKKSVEKYAPSPTPTPSPAATPVPIDPADVITVETPESGPQISFNGPETKKTLNCTKFNRVMINQDDAEITVNGVCSQMVVNGDDNKIAMVAVSEVVFNGDGNTVTHTKYANGKHILTSDNSGSNSVEKIATDQKPAAK